MYRRRKTLSMETGIITTVKGRHYVQPLPRWRNSVQTKQAHWLQSKLLLSNGSSSVSFYIYSFYSPSSCNLTAWFFYIKNYKQIQKQHTQNKSHNIFKHVWISSKGFVFFWKKGIYKMCVCVNTKSRNQTEPWGRVNMRICTEKHSIHSFITLATKSY